MEKYFDKNGAQVKAGDKIRFTLYDGVPNKEFIVREDREYTLFPHTMKYLEFEIIGDVGDE